MLMVLYLKTCAMPVGIVSFVLAPTTAATTYRGVRRGVGTATAGAVALRVPGTPSGCQMPGARVRIPGSLAR
jgi:hypothetical protein